ncbi:CaiB/BaiF CoA transferase family protein [Propionibacteriaceae bacterium G1746]
MAEGALGGLRVLDASTLFAGPLAAMFLGDQGAEVIKIEHPAKPDPSRSHGPSKDGHNLWWKTLGRNKRCLTLDLSHERGRKILLDLALDADVLVENFRPGTLERWGIGPADLHAVNPRLVLCRVTGFGQFGPYASRPGFGTLAEAMSGFAALNGDPDGPPMLPPFALADGIAGLAAALAVTTALQARHSTGRGQVVDLAIIEPILTLLGPQVTRLQQLGTVQARTGNRSANNAPRNIYQSLDGEWLAISTSSPSTAERLMRLVGRADVIEEPWFGTSSGRVEHADELDAAVSAWISEHEAAEVIVACERAGAAVAPVYNARHIVKDPQYQALGTVVTLPDDELGEVDMLNVMFRLSETPGSVRFAGRTHGADTNDLLAQLGYASKEIEGLRSEGVV